MSGYFLIYDLRPILEIKVSFIFSLIKRFRDFLYKLAILSRRVYYYLPKTLLLYNDWLEIIIGL